MDERPHVDMRSIAKAIGLSEQQVASVAALLDDGNTVPFITRYRKEQTGNLDEEQIRAIQKEITGRRQLAERAEAILRLIDAQGKLTPELRQEIQAADSLKRLEDLYLPFRPKRTSRASQARDRGLQPLADAIWNADPAITALDAAAAAYVDPENELADVESVLQGASDILAELISEDADVRARCRRIAESTGRLEVSAAKDAGEAAKEYRDYFNFSEEVRSIPPHRVLAINRGEKTGALKVKFAWDEPRAVTLLIIQLRLNDHPHGEFLQRCLTDAISRLIGPSLEREIRREISEAAESHAIEVFARNLRNLLLQPPIQGQRVVAVDPGFRTGCKVAVLDDCGNHVAHDVIFVTGSEEKRAAAIEKLAGVLAEHQCELIAIGNGTACRETEELVSEMIRTKVPSARYLIVNEAGASIYSTSAVARSEFPDLDATVRGTVSIGRRLLDPLSELVKIEPQHIGVGLYQHDLNSKRLKQSLDEVVESCVNYVGVELNTASASLLRYVSGFNQLIARRVVEWRDQHGRFTSREQLKEVAGIGEATFTQAAGFLKIGDGAEILDSTWIHPESYASTQKLLKRLDISADAILQGQIGTEDIRARIDGLDRDALAEELNTGRPTLDDILDALLRPGRDPRDDLAGPVFRQGILKLDDLEPDMELRGTVLNVVDFGAFVDVGLKDSGLVHVSQLADRFVKTPHDVVSVGDVVTVWVLGVDSDRKRVSLTMISPERRQEPKPKPKRRRRKKKKKGGTKPPEATKEHPEAGQAEPATAPVAEPTQEGESAESPTEDSPSQLSPESQRAPEPEPPNSDGGANQDAENAAEPDPPDTLRSP